MSNKTLIEVMSDKEFADWVGEDKPDESIAGTPLEDGGIPAPEEADKEQPDIDDILAFHHDKDPETGECVYAPHLIKHALYQRLAAEADLTWKQDDGTDEEYISISKLKAIMEIKES